ncbi:MAG: hypothetical protein M3P49_02290 [Actinomycetota bacterium]|nr:hypothetical protein [Actinomycetota bacterium]
MRFFDDNPTNASRALQIWQILVAKASNRQTLTYGMLAGMLGYKGAGGLGSQLQPIMRYCQQNNLPALTVLVVNKDTGLPGVGLVGAELNAGREAVFQYELYKIYPPTVEELKAASGQEATG